MVDLREISNSAAQLCGKIPRQIPMMHTICGGLRALPAGFRIFRGGGANPCPGVSLFWGRDVGAVTYATSLARESKQGCGQRCRQV